MDDIAEDLSIGEQPVPEVEVERTLVPDLSPPIPPPTAPAPLETAGQSSTSQEPPEHIQRFLGCFRCGHSIGGADGPSRGHSRA